MVERNAGDLEAKPADAYDVGEPVIYNQDDVERLININPLAAEQLKVLALTRMICEKNERIAELEKAAG